MASEGHQVPGCRPCIVAEAPGAHAGPSQDLCAGLRVPEKRGASLVLERRNQDPKRDRTGDVRGDSYNAAEHRRFRPLQQPDITLSEVRDHALARADQRQVRLRRRGLRREQSTKTQRMRSRRNHRGRPPITTGSTLP